jgi:hypothetical protein
MEIHANFLKRAVVHSRQLAWVPSPSPGVERRMLDRVGAEVARATSIVRYAPGCSFAPHTHHGGEEYLVLEGVFSDENGDHSAGSYVRNPPTSSHTPRSLGGCTIFVKLWQFDPADRSGIDIDAAKLPYLNSPGRPGVAIMPLFADAHEVVRIERWVPEAEVVLAAAGGIELLVLDGGFVEHGEAFVPGSWLRLPVGAPLSARVVTEGARVWIKTGHLAILRGPLAPPGYASSAALP